MSLPGVDPPCTPPLPTQPTEITGVSKTRPLNFPAPLPTYIENVTSGGPSQVSGYPHETVELSSPINTSGESKIFGRSRIDGSPVPPTGSHPQDQCHDRERATDDGLHTHKEEDLFVNFALLSHLAFRLRDSVPRGIHIKGNIPHPGAFTGRDVVSTIHAQIQGGLLTNHGIPTDDRRAALQAARGLQKQFFFCEVDRSSRALTDDVENIYMFLGDQVEGGFDTPIRPEELPTGVVTYLTKCYTPCCVPGHPCYAYSCPRRGQSSWLPATEIPPPRAWQEWVPPGTLAYIPESEIGRQTIIRHFIKDEEQYVEDLDCIEEVYIRPLQNANPPVIPGGAREFIHEIFGSILDLRECNRCLLGAMHIRQREQGEIVSKIGDIFLDAATVFCQAYPTYTGRLVGVEKRLKQEIGDNRELRVFLEQCIWHPSNVNRMDLKRWLDLPYERLDKYPVIWEAILMRTAEGSPDVDFLRKAVEAMRNLQSITHLREFQAAMGKGPMGKLEWHNLVPDGVRNGISNQISRRQSMIFEHIRGEMEYVEDLENIEHMYVKPLRSMDPPIIPHERLDPFIRDVFHNFGELHEHHRLLLDQFFQIQREQHPFIRSIAPPMHNAVLNFRDAYLDYIPNYPIAQYRLDQEMANNPRFRAFVEQSRQHPDARRFDMKSFIHRPIPRLIRYEHLLRGILEETPAGHDDLKIIPTIMTAIKDLRKEADPGFVLARQKVETWKYNANLVFKFGEVVDMDLLNEERLLIHTGKFLRQPKTGFGWGGWTELFAVLFDNYFVLTEPRECDGETKYQVYLRPIPLDLLTLAAFTDPPVQRSGGLLPFGSRKGTEGPSQNVSFPAMDTSTSASNDAGVVYPCTIHYNGRSGGLLTLYTESPQARSEWKIKLEETIGLRKVAQESNKLFEVEILSVNTFLAPAFTANAGISWGEGRNFTGKVTCSIPFTTPNGRDMVAIGCAEGVWVGSRHDPRSMRRMLNLRMVTQFAMLEDFDIFLVLADKSLFAYYIGVLIPSSSGVASTPQTCQKLNQKDVQFFAVGNIGGRVLVVFMMEKNIFRVLELVVGKGNEKVEAQPYTGSNLDPQSPWSAQFRVYRDFFLPCTSSDVIFLREKIAILCNKGFEIMDLSGLTSVTIPSVEDPRLERLGRRTEQCRPIGMFRSTNDEFLLCYDECGLYVDKHGEPSRRISMVEWEGIAERAAWVPPCILLFGKRFIEIRHVETGHLVQVIPGFDMRCTWDGRGTSDSRAVFQDLMPGGAVSRESRVHGVMTEETPQHCKVAAAERVFELVLTVPLPMSGPLAPS